MDIEGRGIECVRCSEELNIRNVPTDSDGNLKTLDGEVVCRSCFEKEWSENRDLLRYEPVTDSSSFDVGLRDKVMGENVIPLQEPSEIIGIANGLYNKAVVMKDRKENGTQSSKHKKSKRSSDKDVDNQLDITMKDTR